MLYSKLLSIYDQNKHLQNLFDFEKYEEMLSQYVKAEVNFDHTYLSPFRFAKMFKDDLTLEDAIKFLIAISSVGESDFIQIKYRYQCEECDAINNFCSNEILNEELQCRDCSSYIYDQVSSKDDFVIVFYLSKTIVNYYKTSLKVNPLSKEDADVGRGVSMETASKILNENPDLNKEVYDENKKYETYWGYIL